MTTVTTGARIPLEAIEGIIAKAMDGLDLEHDTEWVRPPSCPCHRGEQSCLLPSDAGSCRGHTAEVMTPEEHVVNLDIMAAALPEPDSDGTVDTVTAARSLISVIEERLGATYILRYHHLRKRLIEVSEEYELAHGAVSNAPPSPGYSPKCQWCTAPIAAARGPKARYCSNSHRVMASRARKREAERVNAAASADR
jgi:hypothetical protein